MCFFDQQRFTCGDCVWGEFQQHCEKEWRVGETCGIRLTKDIIQVDTRCEPCEEVDTKTQRRAAEADKLQRRVEEWAEPQARAALEASSELVTMDVIWKCDGFVESVHPKASKIPDTCEIGKLADSIQTLDDEISHLNRERKLISDGHTPESPVQWPGKITEPLDSLGTTSHLAVATDSFVRPIERFAVILYEQSGMQHWSDYTEGNKSLEWVRNYFESSLVVFATQMLSVSAAVVSSPKHAGEKDVGLTLLGAALIQHYKAPIAEHLSARIFRQIFATVPSVRVLLQQMGPKYFSTERFDLDTETMIALEEALKWRTTNAELENIPHLLASTNEMQHLALGVRRDLYRDDSSAMRTIETTMSEKNVDRLADGHYMATFQAYWPVAGFMTTEYGEYKPRFGSVLTLTGSSLYAQALTCADYIKTTWPHTGSFFLELLDRLYNYLVLSSAFKTRQVSLTSGQGLSVQANVSSSYALATFVNFAASAADKDLLVQLAQQLCWFSAAFTTSPLMGLMAYSSPLFVQKKPGVFVIIVRHKPINEREKACWLPLFDGACIVAGFPISQRGQEIGLEVSLNLLAGLSGARHVVEYKGGLVMKGFSHFFVPVRREHDRVQWHGFSSRDEETPLSYNEGISCCISRAMLHEVGLQDLASLRAIVGWCSAATICLGSSQADYENIEYTKSKGANSGPRCTGTSFGFQHIGVAALDVKFGSKDGKCHFQRDGPYKKILQFAENTPIVLHDVEGKLTWLVPATNVMLHIVQHRHHSIPFEVDGRPITLITDIRKGSSAKDVLLGNRIRVLDEQDNHTFEDEILNIWSILEFLHDENISRQRNTSGFSVSMRFGESLHGFEFKDVVHQNTPFKLKEASISDDHGGWLRLIEDIDALVLFANGFGDVILPADESHNVLCHNWRRVPRGKDYLTTTTKMLQILFDKAGCRRDQKYLTTKTKLRWHQGSTELFNTCQDKAHCDHTHLQQLVPKSKIKDVRPPSFIGSEGAVIFGRR